MTADDLERLNTIANNVYNDHININELKEGITKYS